MPTVKAIDGRGDGGMRKLAPIDVNDRASVLLLIRQRLTIMLPPIKSRGQRQTSGRQFIQPQELAPRAHPILHSSLKATERYMQVQRQPSS